MMPPGFFVDRGRSNGGSRGMAHGVPGFPYPEAGPCAHSHHYSRRAPPPNAENLDGRPRMLMPASMAMPSAVGPEVWDPQAMAAHRHMTLITQSHAAAQRANWEARTSALPPQACPPGFRPPMWRDEPAVFMQPPKPEVSFCSAEPIACRPPFNMNDRVDDPVGNHHNYVHSQTTMLGGAPERRVWFVDEGLQREGSGMAESRIAYPQKLPIYRPPHPPIEQARNQIRGPAMKWENHWREPLPHYDGPPPPPPPPPQLLKDGLPTALYLEEFSAKRPQKEHRASTPTPSNRRHIGDVGGSLQKPPPSKRPRTDGYSRRDLEMESGRSYASRIIEERSSDRQSELPSSSHRKKHQGDGTLLNSGEGRTEYPPTLDRQQQARVSNFPARGSCERNPSSSRLKDRSELHSEATRDLHSRSRSSWSRGSRHESCDQERPVPRSKENQLGNVSLADTRNRREPYDSRISSQGRGSRSPDGHRHHSRRSSREVESSPWKDRSIRSSSGKRSTVEKTMEHMSSRLRNTQRRADSFPKSNANHKEQSCDLDAPTKLTSNSKGVAPALTDKVEAKAEPVTTLRTDSLEKRSKIVLEAEQSGDLERQIRIQGASLPPNLKGKASLNPSKGKQKFKENLAAHMKSVSAESTTTMGALQNPISTTMLCKSTPQVMEVDSQCPPEKVTPRRRSSLGIKPDLALVKSSGADGREFLSRGKQGLHVLRNPAMRNRQNEDGAQKQARHAGNVSGSSLGLKPVTEKSSKELQERSQNALGGTTKIERPSSKIHMKDSKFPSEEILQTPVKQGLSHGPDTQKSAVSEAGNGSDGRSVQKVIFTGHKSEQCPKDVIINKLGTGSHSSQSFGKSINPGMVVKYGQSLGTTSSRQMKDLSSSPVVRKDNAIPHLSPHTRIESSSDGSPLLRLSVQPPAPLSLEKEQVDLTRTSSKKSDPVSFSRINQESKGIRLSGKSSDIMKGLERHSSAIIQPPSESSPNSLKGQSLIRVMPLSSSKEDLQRSADRVKVHPFSHNEVDVRACLSLGEPPILPTDPLTVREVRLFGTNLNASKSVILEVDKDTQTDCSTEVSCPSSVHSDLPVPSALKADKEIDDSRHAVSTGADSETGGRFDKVIVDEGEAGALGKEDGQLVPKQIEEVVRKIASANEPSGKRQKILQLKKEGNPEQTRRSCGAAIESNKTGEHELQHVVEGSNQEACLVEQQMTNLDGDIRHLVPVTKIVDTTSTTRHPLLKAKSMSQIQESRSGIISRPYGGNKIWRRDSITASNRNGMTQVGARLTSGPAVVPQPAAYVRKKYSIIRFPATQSAMSMSGSVQRAAVARPIGPESGGKGSVLTAPNPFTNSLSVPVRPSIITPVTSIGVTPIIIQCTNANITEHVAVASGQSSVSTVKRLKPQGGETIESPPVLIESYNPITPDSKLSIASPAHIEPSSGIAKTACNPADIAGKDREKAFGYVVSGTRLYMQRKANQLIVAPSSDSSTILTFSEKPEIPLGRAPVDVYVKKKTNQLVRYSVRKEAGDKSALPDDGEELLKGEIKQRRFPLQMKTKLGRVLSQKNGRALGSARVWTLNNEVRCSIMGMAISRTRRFPPLFPWKRVNSAAPRVRRCSSLPEGKQGALFLHISNKLQRFRSGHPVYTRSADGFSLHRSGVVSQRGANLKWTKSLEKQSLFASEAATKVVAEAEKKKRDRKKAVVLAVAKARELRALQNAATTAKLLPGTAGVTAVGLIGPSSALTSEMSQNDGAIYVRKGFGNQLVRDLKTATRAFASEKVRWSLHNARFRRAKKQAFCVYFTRFGECKRGDGKCLYIHDVDKVAVCTKFLKGSCSNLKCPLTHKVIPERMSDCSYFLEGLCTNEACPYRHVNVNPKAPICEGFLRGYCADGDMVNHNPQAQKFQLCPGCECNKKHTYVCPEYTETGMCSQTGTCKLRHPKMKQRSPVVKDPVSQKRDRRYFTSAAVAEVSSGNEQVLDTYYGKLTDAGEERTDFISIEDIGVESSKEYQEYDKVNDHSKQERLCELPKINSNTGLENLLRPRLLLEELAATV